MIQIKEHTNLKLNFQKLHVHLTYGVTLWGNLASTGAVYISEGFLEEFREFLKT